MATGLISTQPPRAFSTPKYIKNARISPTVNETTLVPTELAEIREYQTAEGANAVSVKAQTDLYKMLDPTDVPDIPASYFRQGDKSFQALIKEEDLFHKYNTRHENITQQGLARVNQMTRVIEFEKQVDDYFYAGRRPAKLHNEIHNSLNQPKKPLTQADIDKLESRILGQDTTLFSDFAALQYIVYSVRLQDFIRKNFNMNPRNGRITSYFAKNLRSVLINMFKNANVPYPDFLGYVPVTTQMPQPYNVDVPHRVTTRTGVFDRATSALHAIAGHPHHAMNEAVSNADENHRNALQDEALNKQVVVRRPDIETTLPPAPYQPADIPDTFLRDNMTREEYQNIQQQYDEAYGGQTRQATPQEPIRAPETTPIQSGATAPPQQSAGESVADFLNRVRQTQPQYTLGGSGVTASGEAEAREKYQERQRLLAEEGQKKKRGRP